MMRTWLSFMKCVPSPLLPMKPYRSMPLSFTCVVFGKITSTTVLLTQKWMLRGSLHYLALIPPSQKMGIKAKLRLSILNLMRIWFSQGRRNAKLDILPLMRCPKCNSENLERLSATEIACKGCDAPYKIDRNIFQIH